MSSEYQELYGDMVKRLMILRKHYNEITDDMLAAMNLPNRREIDTMQERQQQTRRENIALKRELAEIRSLLAAGSKKAAARPAVKKAAKGKTASAKKAAPRKKASASKSVKSTASSKAKSGA